MSPGNTILEFCHVWVFRHPLLSSSSSSGCWEVCPHCTNVGLGRTWGWSQCRHEGERTTARIWASWLLQFFLLRFFTGLRLVVISACALSVRTEEGLGLLRNQEPGHVWYRSCQLSLSPGSGQMGGKICFPWSAEAILTPGCAPICPSPLWTAGLPER